MNRIIQGDALERLRELPAASVDCCVTSPPYYQLRDYGVEGQIGLEETVEEYIGKLVNIFREVRRVLKKDGTLWLNISDSYAGSTKGAARSAENARKYKQGTNKGLLGSGLRATPLNGCKPKDLLGIPWILALALRNDGWYLRQDIIWQKPNPMPESVKDRCTKSHEYIFLLSKSRKYYFDGEAIAEPAAVSTLKRLSQNVEKQLGSERVQGKTNGPMKAVKPRYGGKKYTEDPEVFNRTKSGTLYDYTLKRNKRDVWTVTTKPFRGAHFATFPQDLIVPCVLAGSRVGGVVLDPFAGSGTTGVVAAVNGRRYVLIELSENYVEICKERLNSNEHEKEIQ